MREGGLRRTKYPCVYFTFSKRHHPIFYTVALEEKAELKGENEARIGEVCVDIRSIRIT